MLVATVASYWWLDASWLLFAVLILTPDLSMLGYLAGPRVGAVAYNVFHSLIGPLALFALGLAAGLLWAAPVATIWLAHIAADRMLGYGLKLASDFSQTHMGPIGRRRSA